MFDFRFDEVRENFEAAIQQHYDTTQETQCEVRIDQAELKSKWTSILKASQMFKKDPEGGNGVLEEEAEEVQEGAGGEESVG